MLADPAHAVDSFGRGLRDELDATVCWLVDQGGTPGLYREQWPGDVASLKGEHMSALIPRIKPV